MKTASVKKKSPPPSQDELRRNLMVQIATHAPSKGWSKAALSLGAEDLTLTSQQVATLYPGGIEEVMEYFSRSIDMAMCETLAQRDLSALRVRERISEAVMTRLELLSPYRKAAQRLAIDLARPQRLALATRLMALTIDDIWRAAGDVSSGFSHYSKRTTLAIIYTSILPIWFRDDSDHNAKTAHHLNQRIDKLMQVSGQIRTLRQGICRRRKTLF